MKGAAGRMRIQLITRRNQQQGHINPENYPQCKLSDPCDLSNARDPWKTERVRTSYHEEQILTKLAPPPGEPTLCMNDVKIQSPL